MKPFIRWLIRRDMFEVLHIERDSFEFAWTEEDFLKTLRASSIIGMVAEREEKIVDYMIYELHKGKLHVLNFAVDPECRRLGVGRAMIDKLTGKLSVHRRTRITLQARDSNLSAHLFFRACGFRASKVLRRFYEDSGDDAYEFVYRLPVTQEIAT